MRAPLLTLFAALLTLAGCNGKVQNVTPSGNAVDTIKRILKAASTDTVRDTVILWRPVRDTLIRHLEDPCYGENPPQDCPEFEMDSVRKP
jgi:hypothetical protein